MIAAARRFLENPLVGRQISTHLTGPRLGLVFVLVAGALLLADTITFSTVLLSNDTPIVEGTTGAYLSSVNFLVLLGLLIALLPIRLAGSIDGSRMDKVFDQVVVTGVSPIRIQLGNWALAISYALGLLLVSLPFQGYAFMLGGVSLSSLLRGYGVLAIYSNVIIAASLGLFVLEREWLGVPATIANFGIAMLLGFSPLPGVVGWITPVRFFAPTLYGSLPIARWPDSDPVLYLFNVPEPIYPFLLWAIVAAPFAALVFLGPAHRFLPGLNNFGNIVLAGDRRRRIFRKARLAMTRRVELAFFYENRPRWLDRIDYPLRLTLFLGLIGFLWAAIIGLCTDGMPSFQSVNFHSRRDPRAILSILLTSLVLFHAVLVLGDARQKLGWTEWIGRFRLPRGPLQGSALLFLIAVFITLHWIVVRQALEGAAAGPNPGEGGGELANACAREWAELLAAIALFAVNWYLLGRILARAVETQAALRFLLLLSAGAVLIGPLVLLMGLSERWLPRDFFPFLFLTPVLLILAREENAMRGAAPPGFQPDEAFGRYLTCQGAITAALILGFGTILLVSWNRKRTQKRLKAAAAAPLLLAITTLLVGAGLRAEERALPLKIECTCGFGGASFDTNGAESRTFFTLVIENSGATEIRGALSLQIRNSNVESSRPFVAPPGTRTVLRWSESAALSRWIGFGACTFVLNAREGTLEIPIPQSDVKRRNSRDDIRNFLLVTDGPRTPERGPGQNENWIVTRDSYLPEDHRAYSQVDTVLVDGADLSRWTAGQRQALLDYVRWGGAVVFHGSIDRATVQTLEGWSPILSVRRSLRVEVGGALVSLEDLEDSSSWGEIETGGELQTVPILSIRPVAFGRVGHLNVDPTGAFLDRKVWNSIWSEGMPRSEYLSGLSRSTPEPLDLRDSTSLLAVAGFFCAYALLVGPFGFFALRKRSRRRWIPLWTIALPLGFVALLPLLLASFHLQPSYATLTRVAFFGPGARHGVAFARIDVRSSGRQEHRVQLEGRNLSACSVEFAGNHGRYSFGPDVPELSRLAISTGVDGGPQLDLHTQPWGRRRVHVVGDTELKHPITGRAIYSSRTKRVSITAQGLSPEIWSDRSQFTGYAFVRLTAGQSMRTADLALGSLDGGTLTLDLSADPITDTLSAALVQNRRLVVDELGLDFPERPGVYLAIESGQVGIGLRTKDLAFERALREPPERIPGTAALPAGLVKRNGKLVRSFERSFVVVELPLETR